MVFLMFQVSSFVCAYDSFRGSSKPLDEDGTMYLLIPMLFVGSPHRSRRQINHSLSLKTR
jgi:hypothetical protein